MISGLCGAFHSSVGGGPDSRRYLAVQFSGTVRGGAGPTPSRSPSILAMRPWRARGLSGSACRYVETGHTLNVKPCGVHQGGASDWASLNTSATLRAPCYHATPHRMPVDCGQACRYVETGLTPNPRAHAAASEHSGVLATTRPHWEKRRNPKP